MVGPAVFCQPVCNAYNHSPDCDCGFGGVWYGNLPGHSSGRPPGLIADQNWHEIACWWCGQRVFFVRNTNTGGCFLCDEMGEPWPMHPCWEEHAADFPSHISHVLFERLARKRSFAFIVRPDDERKYANFAGHVIWIQPIGPGNHDPRHTTPWHSSRGRLMITAVEIGLDDGRFAAINYARGDVVYDVHVGDRIAGHTHWRKRNSKWIMIGGPLHVGGRRMSHRLEDPDNPGADEVQTRLDSLRHEESRRPKKRRGRWRS
jgi:hypothetical protein